MDWKTLGFTVDFLQGIPFTGSFFYLFLMKGTMGFKMGSLHSKRLDYLTHLVPGFGQPPMDGYGI